MFIYFVLIFFLVGIRAVYHWSTLEVMRRKADPALESLPKKHASFIEPMECLLVPKLPEGALWVYEVKLDGHRAIGVNPR
jgi:ATP-dependent DNA ligase